MDQYGQKNSVAMRERRDGGEYEMDWDDSVFSISRYGAKVTLGLPGDDKRQARRGGVGVEGRSGSTICIVGTTSGGVKVCSLLFL